MVSTTLIDSFMCVCYKGMSNMYFATEFALYGSHPHVDDKIRSLDVENKIRIISNVITENSKRIEMFESLKLIVSILHDTGIQIQQTMSNIQTEIDRYNNSFFKYWRLPNCDPHVDRLVELSAIFETKSKMLLELLALYKDHHVLNQNKLQVSEEKRAT